MNARRETLVVPAGNPSLSNSIQLNAGERIASVRLPSLPATGTATYMIGVIEGSSDNSTFLPIYNFKETVVLPFAGTVYSGLAGVLAPLVIRPASVNNNVSVAQQYIMPNESARESMPPYVRVRFCSYTPNTIANIDLGTLNGGPVSIVVNIITD